MNLGPWAEALTIDCYIDRILYGDYSEYDDLAGVGPHFNREADEYKRDEMKKDIMDFSFLIERAIESKELKVEIIKQINVNSVREYHIVPSEFITWAHNKCFRIPDPFKVLINNIHPDMPSPKGQETSRSGITTKPNFELFIKESLLQNSELNFS